MERKWWTLTAVVIGIFMLLLDVTIVNVALPDIEKGFKASLSDVQWVIDAYALTLAAGLLTAGSLADRFGRRILFAIGATVFTAGSLLCGLANGTLFLDLARAGQGVGGAVMFATALALLSDAFRGRDRGIAFGVFGATTGVAVAVGPVLGGVITSGLGWRWIFLVNVPIGVIAVLITLTRVAESRNPHASRPDWFGFLTFSGALGALVYGLITSSSEGWGAAKVVWPLVAAGVLFAAFLAVEFMGRHPMLDMSLFRKPAFTGGLVAAFGVSAGLFAMFTYLVLYLQDVLGYSAVETGVRFLTISGAIFLTAGVAGRLTSSAPPRLLIGTGFLLIGGGLLLMHGVTVTSGWTHLIPGFVLAGAGAGLVNTPLASVAVSVVEPARSGMASGINSTLRQVGIATGIAVLGSLFSGTLRDSARTDLQHGPLAAHARQIAKGLGGLQGGGGKGQSPETARIVGHAVRTGFVDGLNQILIVAAVISFAAALASFALIRGKDLVAQGHDAPAPESPVTATTAS